MARTDIGREAENNKWHIQHFQCKVLWISAANIFQELRLPYGTVP